MTSTWTPNPRTHASPSKTYEWASEQLTGRCKDRRKLCNNTYLLRRDKDTIAVRLHETDIVTFFADGDIDIYTGGWNTVTTKDRINGYSPVRVYSEHGHMFAHYGDWDKGETVAFTGNGVKLSSGKLIGKSADAARQEIREELNEARREPARANAWIRKANGWFVDRKACTASRWQCESRGWRARRGNIRNGGVESDTVLWCGCRVYHKPYSGKLTVEQIMQETNSTVRLAKMRCYGIERFFLDAKAAVIHEQAGYQLLDISFTDRWHVDHVRALKMNCSTTNAVYINSVPPTLDTVPDAVDWMFNTKDYLGQVSQQA